MHRLIMRWLSAPSLLCAVVVLVCGFNASVRALPAFSIPPVPSLSAGSYILVEASTGYVLAEHLADQPRPPASLTKVMSSYVLAGYLQTGLLLEDELVTVSKKAWAQNPRYKNSSLMWIEPGKRVSLLDLYRGMVVSSGNDAAVAVAEHISGSEEDFVALLNTRARDLGMRDTYFSNAHGLTSTSSSAHTTARDMAILARAVVNHYPKYYDYYAEREFEYNGITQVNRNVLLRTLEGVDGIKTGYTALAGYCLLSSAERYGMRLIAVVMGSKSNAERLRDTRILLEYGFRYFMVQTLLHRGQSVTDTRVYGGDITQLSLGVEQDVNMVTPRGQTSDIQRYMQLNNSVQAPVSIGSTLGTVHYSYDGERLASASLVALREVHVGGWIRRTIDWVYLGFRNFFIDDA